MKSTIIFLFFLIMSGKLTVAQQIWELVGIPYGGEITSITIKDSLTFTGTQTSCIYKSSDFGNHWNKVKNGDNQAGNIGVSGLVMTSNNILFASCYDGGLFRSDDLGETWISLGKGPGFLYLTKNGQKLFHLPPYEYLESNFEYSSDYGNTWEVIDIPFLAHMTKFITTSDENTWILATLSRIFISTDAGTTWIFRGNGLPSKVYSLFINQRDELFAGTNDGIYYSSNLGIDWEFRNQGVPPDTKINDITGLNDSVIVVGTYFGPYISQNKGLNWSLLSPNFQINSVCTSNSDIFLGSINGIYLIADSSIYRRSFGIQDIRIKTINYLDNTMFVGTDGGLYYSNNNGKDWEFSDEIRPGNIHRIEIDSPYIYLTQGLSGLWRSSDAGTNWEFLEQEGCCTDIVSFSNHMVSSGFYYYYSHLPPASGIHYSTDKGNSWIAGALNYTHIINSLGKNSAQKLFIGTEDIFQNPGYHSLFVSYNYGASAIISNDGLPDVKINHIAFDGDSIVLLGTESGIYHSTDDGGTWNLLGLAGNNLNSIQVDKNHYIYTSTLSNIFRSTDGGYNFSEFKTGIDGQYFGNLYMSQDQYLYIGTEHGLYRTVNTITENETEIYYYPKSFKLSQNYPNPFNPTTIIKYQIAEFCKVKLTVYDVLGQQIKILVNEEKPAGSYEVEFDGKGLPSGIYFYRIEAGKFSDTKKFILMK